MATQINPTHAGLERVIEGAEAGRALFKDTFTAKNLPTFVLGITMMAIVTFVGRQFNDGTTSFFGEWAMLSFVALITFVLLAPVIARATRSAIETFDVIADSYRIGLADKHYWESAQRDPRVMNEILAAQSRQSSLAEVAAAEAAAVDAYAPHPKPIVWPPLKRKIFN